MLTPPSCKSSTIRNGDHYADGGHFVTSQEIGSLAGGKQASMPPSARSRRGSQLPSARDMRLTERRSARQKQTDQTVARAPQSEVKGDVLAQEGMASARSTARSRFSDGARSGRLSTGRSGSGLPSQRGLTGRSSASGGQEAKVKDMFEKLPPSRREVILQELSSGWLQNQ